MKFELKKEVGALIPKSIDFNYELLKADITTKLANYNNLIVLEDGLRSAKSDRAALRDLKKTIDEKRKEVKKQWNIPCIEFEDKVKELVALIDKPIVKINEQIEVFEQRTKDEKEAAIHAHFDDIIGDLKDLVSYQKLYDPKWMNLGNKLPEIKEIITLIIQSINSDIAVIKDLKTEHEQQMVNKYLENFNMSEALAEKTKIEQQALKLAEYNKLQAMKKAKEEAERIEKEKEIAAKKIAEEQEKEAKKIELEQKKAAANAEAEKEMANREHLSSLIGCEKPPWVEKIEKDQEPVVEVMAQSDYMTGPEKAERVQPVKLEIMNIRMQVSPAQKAALKIFLTENKIRVATKIQW